NPQQPKRIRVILSCGPCRASKLKCDRQDPCSQCHKKGRPQDCRYVPRPARPQKAAKSMAARLRRLEGMVRGLLDEDGNPVTQPTGGMVGEVRASSDKGPSGEDGTRSAQVQAQGTDAGGQVVRGDLGVTNYVGGTHFAAILQDIGELKSYFEYPDDDEGETGGDPFEAGASPEFLLLGQSAPRNREELLSLLPEKSVIDRLMMRYFNSNIPSQHILHKLTFTKEYNEYWQDPHSVSLHWLAVLFMVISLGIFISTFEAPQELAADSPMNSKDRFRLYRDAAGTALIWGKYSQPNQCTLQAMLLYAEAEFVTNRQSQMKCYLLCSVLIRLMLKMGLHRDPSKLPNISPYDGEMRRRVWNLAIQIDLLAAFHLGLPAMIHGIESDTSLPHNLLDSDFNEDSKELPLSRPQSEYTPLSYAINKAALCRVFGLVARQAHSLNIPTYAEVLKLDAVLEETYNAVPTFLRVKPMEKSITDHPMQVIQRYGLASLYQKSRCVLHRKYITDAIPKTEHEYSRRACLSASLELLRYQDLLYNACKPGGMLSPNGWFISSMAVNDFLLADMVVALIIQSEEYPEVIGESKQYTRDSSIPTKDALLDILRRSAFIWQEMCVNVPECKKAAELISTV
ncbi:fungal-specific transcription factor domain-containing protein, partial [Truncatella angustata]